jgi:hypothetical protein
LLTIAGVNLTVTVGLTAVIGGDISQFTSPQKLVSYVGLNPRAGSPGRALLSTPASASRDGRMPDRCSSSQLGPRPQRPSHCALSFSVSATDVAIRSLRSLALAS